MITKTIFPSDGTQTNNKKKATQLHVRSAGGNWQHKLEHLKQVTPTPVPQAKLHL